MFYPNESSYPWDAIVFIRTTYSDGSVYRGSGAMVGPNDILTASHVVTEPGKTLVDIDIYPAYDGNASASYGSFTTGQWRTNYFNVTPTSSGGIYESDSAHDLAIIGISKRLGDTTGTFGMMSYGGSDTYTLSGYPASDGYNLVADTGYTPVIYGGDVFDISGLYHNPGSSGGPLFNSANQIVGVCSTTSWAARIDTEWDQLQAWISGNDDLIGGVPAPSPSPVPSGPPTFLGSTGDDYLTFGAADKIVFGLTGNDTLFIGGGNDLAYGNQGNDYIYLEAGNDTGFGGQQNDNIFGGDGNDVIYGNLQNDYLAGDAGRDTLFGGQGSDTLSGGDGDDLLSGNLGNDYMFGGAGADTFIVGIGTGDDTIAGFSEAEGDKIRVPGPSVSWTTDGNGGTLIMVQGGGTIDLLNVAPLSGNAFIFA